MAAGKLFGVLGLIVTLIQPAAAADKYIRGLPNFEDMALTSDGRWVIGSSMAHVHPPGALYAVEVAARAPKKVEITAAPGTAQCPDGFDPAKFMPHGIDLLGDTLYVVNHGSRESIEVFKISGAANATWVDCIPLATESVANGVAALKDGTLYITNNGLRKYVKMVDGVLVGKGDLQRWNGKVWDVLPGTARVAWNGILVSRDGKHLYTVNTVTRKLYDFTLGGDAAPKTLDLKFAPDNLRLSKDGKTIIVAGFHPGPDGIASSCFQHDRPTCGLKFGFGRVNARTLTPLCMTDMKPQPEFDSSTVAMPVGSELWLGTMKGNAILTTKTCAQ